MRRAQRVKVLRGEIGASTAAVIATSATSGIGMAELWRAIDEGRGSV
jgi:hypothetical protein